MSESFRSIRPKPDEHIEYYSTYIDRVPDGDIVETLSRQTPETLAFLRAIPDSKADHRYAPGKWSIKEIIGHLADGERVFQYRAFRFSRADATAVPGFDENLYVENAPFSRLRMADLIDDLEHLRRSTIHMFGSMDEEAFARRGVANDHEISVRAIAFIMAGHETHHLQVMRERYLNS
jgi:DinB family protein